MVKIHKEYSVLFESCLKVASTIAEADEDLGESFMLLLTFWLNDESPRIKRLLEKEFNRTFSKSGDSFHASIQKLFKEIKDE